MFVLTSPKHSGGKISYAKEKQKVRIESHCSSQFRFHPLQEQNELGSLREEEISSFHQLPHKSLIYERFIHFLSF